MCDPDNIRVQAYRCTDEWMRYPPDPRSVENMVIRMCFILSFIEKCNCNHRFNKKNICRSMSWLEEVEAISELSSFCQTFFCCWHERKMKENKRGMKSVSEEDIIMKLNMPNSLVNCSRNGWKWDELWPRQARI